MADPARPASYPALDTFAADNRVRRNPFRVYMALQRNGFLNFETPVEVLIWYHARLLGIRPASVIGALNWLVAAGYLIEHARTSQHHVRSFTLAREVVADHFPKRTDSHGPPTRS